MNTKVLLIKFITTVILSVMIALLFTACSSEKKDTYFIHAICFDKSEQGYSVSAILEKQKDKDEEYFTATQSGKTISEATEKLSEMYKDCYFATCEYYFIPHDAQSKLIHEIAHEVCDSNLYPTKSDIVCIAHENKNEFLENIKSENDMTKISRLLEGKSVNVISFFAQYSEYGKAFLPSLTPGEEKNTNSANSIVFTDTREGDENE